MARGKKIDIEKRVDIGIAKLANPNLSTRDIAEEEGVGKSTVARIIEEDLGQVGTTEKGKELYDYNLVIINEGAIKVASAMKTMTPEDIREAKDMQSIVETAFKQNQLLDGKPTETIRIQDYSNLSDKELEEARNSLL